MASTPPPAQALTFSIPGLDRLEEIGRGGESLVYRAWHGEQRVAVKLQRNPEPGPEGLHRYRREAALWASVRHPAVAAVYDVGEAEGRPYLVREYVVGRSLAEVLTDGPLSEPALLVLARDLAGALAAIHRRGLILRDLTPRSIAVDSAGHAKIIDFGSAGRRRNTTGELPRLGASFAYSAPEATGLLKRPIDGRADLYTLGVVLFECAAGRLPFEGDEPAETLRLHAAVAPPDLRVLRPQISPALAAIVARLLAKDPDERHPTGESLLADLDALPELNVALAAGRSVALGARHGEPIDPAPLLGRGAELAILRERWRAARRQDGGLVVLMGEPGSGKSRLLRTLVADARGDGALVLEARCAPNDPVPLGPLRRALEGYAAGLARLPPTLRGQAAARVRTAVREVAPLLLAWSPVLASALGAPVAAPAATGAREQFHDALVELLLNLAASPGSVLLALDDAQWLDDGTLHVLSRLAPRLGEAALLVAATTLPAAPGRTSLPPAGSLGLRLGGAPELDLPRTLRVPVGGLSPDAVGGLVISMLGGGPVQGELIERIAAHSQGNPFAVEQYVRALLDAGALHPTWMGWQADAATVGQMELPSDVSELVQRRIASLPVVTRELLQAAAVQGGTFRLDVLAAVCGVGPEAVSSGMNAAAGAWLIERAGEDYRFVHDRIQGALLVGLLDDARRALHQRIAEALEQRPRGDPEEVYALARHAALGAADRDPEHVLAVQLAAGLRALHDFAPEEAYALLLRAQQFAEANRVPVPPTLRRALGDACARTGRQREALEHLDAALAATPEPLERAAIRTRIAEARLTDSDVDEAGLELKRALKELGREAPRSRPLRVLGLAVEYLRGRLARPDATRPEERGTLATLAQLYNFATYVAFFEMRSLRLVEVILRQRTPARRLGPSTPEWVLAECHYAILLTMLRRRERATAHVRAAVAAAERLGDPFVLAKALVHQAWVTHFSGRAREAEVLEIRCLREHGRWLDTFDFLNGCADLAWNFLLRGYAPEGWSWIERGLARDAEAAGAPRGAMGNVYQALAGPLLAALGRSLEAREHLDHVRARVEAAPRERYRAGAFYACLVAFHLEQGEWGPPLEEAIARFERLRLRPERVTPHFKLFYVACAYARLEQLRLAPAPARKARRAALRAALAELRRAADIPVLQVHAAVLEGALASDAGDRAAAQRHLAEAESLARDVDSPWGLFEVARLNARMLTRGGNEASAKREARRAHVLALEHGWAMRARRLQAEFGLEGTDAGAALDASSLVLRRQRDALLQVSVASATVLDPDRQARSALDEVLHILNAERAFLFLSREEGAGELALRAARDAAGADLSGVDEFAWAVAEQVRAQRTPAVLTGDEDSRPAERAGSVLAVPLLLRDRLVGVVYVDNRLTRGLFTPDDVQILLAIGQHIANAMETARAAQLEIYGRIAANVPGLVFRLRRASDGALRFVFVSEGVRDLFELSPEALEGEAELLLERLAPDDRQTFRASLMASAASLTPWRWEGRTLTGDRWLQGIGRPESRMDGDVIWDGLLTDATERKHAEAEARALNVRLEQRVRSRTRELAAANKELEAFNYSVSHDLRSALRSIEGFSAMVLEDHGDALGVEGRDSLERVAAAARRMWGVLDALLNLSRLNRAEIHREQIDLTSVARTVGEDLGRQHPHRRVDLLVAEGLVCEADPTLMRVVVENLVGNAWKYTSDQPQARIELGMLIHEGERVFFVRDDGVGFDMAHADKLFVPFQRLHARDRFEGTGIGLFTVHRILQRHGGRIWAQSAPGAGATFFFTCRRRPGGFEPVLSGEMTPL